MGKPKITNALCHKQKHTFLLMADLSGESLSNYVKINERNYAYKIKLHLAGSYLKNIIWFDEAVV